MAPEFETMLAIGGKDDHEADADHLAESLGINPVIIPEMKRSLRPASDSEAYKKVKDLILKFKPHIVHTHAAKAGVIGRMAAYSCKVPVIVHTFHGHVFHSYFSKWTSNTFIQIERYLAKQSSGIIAISKTQKEELANMYNICPAEKIKIIPLGLDLDKFSGHNSFAKRDRFRKHFHISDNELAIGIIGRIVPVKNHSMFVSVAKNISGKYGKKVKFVVIGDGDMREQMESEFIASGLDYSYFPDNPREATVICTSWQTDMDVVIAGLDIIALTSHNEGTPLSLIEAQAASKPVVSTNVGGVTDVVINGVTGFIVAPGDVDAFSKSIAQLIDDPALREKFGNESSQSVKDKFSYQRLVKDMSAYYYELLGKSHTSG
jgi:glycosyltransferase involved in cell wall biosynthesis